MRLSVWILFISTIMSVLHPANAQSTEDQKLVSFFKEQCQYGQDQAHDLEVLKQLDGIDRSKLSEANQLNYDLYLLNTKQDTEGHRFPDYLTPINQMGGI